MNHGAEAHTMHTVAFWGFSNKNLKTKHESTSTTLKQAPIAFQCRTKFALKFRNTASRQSREIADSGNFRGYQTYSPRPQALNQPRHPRHSLHAGIRAGYVMYTLEGTKQSSSKPWTSVRNSHRTS